MKVCAFRTMKLRHKQEYTQEITYISKQNQPQTSLQSTGDILLSFLVHDCLFHGHTTSWTLDFSPQRLWFCPRGVCIEFAVVKLAVGRVLL